MKKKITAIALVVALLAVAIIGGTLAYFTDTDSAENVFTVGKVNIELEEPKWNPEEEHILLPGKEFDKDPTITVEADSEDCYLFVRLDLVRYVPLLAAFLEDNGYVKEDLMKHSVREEFTSQYFEGFEDEKWDIMNVDAILAALAEGNPTHLIVDLGYKAEGGVLEAGDSVQLISKIKMPATVDSKEARLFWEYADGSVKTENTPVIIGITAYGIQAEGLDDLAAAYTALTGSDVNLEYQWTKAVG